MPGTDTPITMEIADWVSSTGHSDLPDEVRHHVRRSLVDYLTATLLGATSEPAALVREYYSAHDSDRTSTVIGTTSRLSPANAAAVNGTAAHALDLDDGYTPGGFHPSGPLVSAALAVAEDLASEADDIVRAIALGYEVACRLAGGTHPSQRDRGFHNTALVGVFGAATAVGALHHLDPLRLANAYGLAGSHAGGLNAYLDEGSDVKRYHSGKAARDGLVSAELGARGLTAPTTVLEGPRGYLHAFAGGEFDIDHIVGDLGTTWRMLRTYNKPYPCCRHVHGAIDAALDIREREGLAPESIESVRVETFAIAAHHDNKHIGHILDAQMSLPYSVSAALVHGEVGMDQFGQDARDDARLHRILETVEVSTDQQHTSDYPRMRPARVFVRANGKEFVEEVSQPYGEPDNPMTDADLDAKFRRLTGPVLGEERAARIVEAAWALDDPKRLFVDLAGEALTPVS